MQVYDGQFDHRVIELTARAIEDELLTGISYQGDKQISYCSSRRLLQMSLSTAGVAHLNDGHRATLA